MDLTYNVFSLFDILALLQGIAFGCSFLLLNKSKNKSTFFLGLLLILFSLELIPHILWDLGVYDYYPKLYGLPFNFYWIIYPVFYIYTQKVSIFADHKIKYWLLYPGILAYVIQLYIFFQPYTIKIDIFENIGFTIFTVSGAIYSWIVAMWNFKLLKNHRIEVQNSFSRVENKGLEWARTFIIFSVIGSSLSLFGFYLFDNNIYSKIAYTIFNLSVIYWLSYHGIFQQNILFLLSNNGKSPLTQNEYFEESENSLSKNEDMHELMEQIDAYMASSEGFRHTELTIVDLAKNLNMHTKRISTVINTARKQNFNTYINNLRIKMAIELLESPNRNKYSMEGIGTEVGFNSKSTFYVAFKKVTGTTPIKYKERLAV